MQETAVMRAYVTVRSEGQHPDIHSLTGANSMVQRMCMMQEVVSEKNRSELRLWSHGVVPMVWWYPVFPAWAWNRWIRHGPWWPWFPLLTFRLLNSWLIRTSFNPAAWLSFYQIRMGWVVFNGKHMKTWSTGAKQDWFFDLFLRMNIGRAQKWLMPGTMATGVTVHVTTVVSWPGNGRNASPCVVFCTQVRYRNKQRQNQQNYTKLQPNLSKRNMKE